jgi:hypothetical protein
VILSDHISLHIDKKIKQVHDRITNPPITDAIRRAHPKERPQVERELRDLVRLLRYLDYASQ